MVDYLYPLSLFITPHGWGVTKTLPLHVHRKIKNSKKKFESFGIGFKFKIPIGKLVNSEFNFLFWFGILKGNLRPNYQNNVLGTNSIIYKLISLYRYNKSYNKSG